ncbi:hypothetical protein PsYK624_022190 [Phanerochaete sordida]|uniref:Uncharacterized protein n=1 Tax=Phanerochaete sordida TaxID=48140 RepID=A0A9P3L948_9APHY|nr:hypothetical protein PsYK624_022190 [Phanerochaete sordida]
MTSFDSIPDIKSQHDSEPPAYSESVVLYPTTADVSERYSQAYPLVESIEFTIPAGLHAGLPDLPLPEDVDEEGKVVKYELCAPPVQWVQHPHPEGATYFINNLINVVTDSNILRADIFGVFMEGVGQVQSLAANLDIKISASVELYVRAELGKENKCHYYLVNHQARTEFWLNDNDLVDLGFSRVVSRPHLRYVLEEHYWTHVEYFPHNPIPIHLIRELVSILRHGQLDHETSRSSTFPFDAAQCKSFIKLLSVDEQETRSPYFTCMAARLWTSISKHRFDNMYGEEFARLDRRTRRREPNSEGEPCYMRLASTLLLDHNRAITAKIDDLYIDETTYTMHWRNFLETMNGSWRNHRLESTVLLIASAILVSHPRGILDYYVGLAAIACSALALVASVMMLNMFQEKLQLVAIEAVAYLSEQKHSKLGFQPLALLMSVPKALTSYSFAIFLTQIFSFIIASTGAPLLLSIIIVFMPHAAALVFFTAKFVATLSLDLWRRRRREYGCPV